MSRAKEIFDRTFLEKNTASTSQRTVESDSDSDKEEEKVRKFKRDKNGPIFYSTRINEPYYLGLNAIIWLGTNEICICY